MLFKPESKDDAKIEGVDRLFVHDPFGNRVTFWQPTPKG